MLALSVRFPEVALIAQGIKTVEVRRWPTRHRGNLLIVSSKLPAAEARSPLCARVPSGAAICVVDLLDCRPMRPSDAEAAMCDSAPGLYAWCIKLRYWTSAMPVRGFVKLWEVDDDLIHRGRAPRWLFG